MDAALISAIGSPRRREILRLLWDQDLTAGAIHQAMPDVTFGAVSLQLKVLADAGLVESRADAQFRVYHLRREALGPVAAMLQAMWSDALWHLKLKSELKESRRGPSPRSKSKKGKEMITSTLRLDRTIVIHARPATVFEFFTNAQDWAAWWGAGSHIDARPGGRLLIRHPNGVEVTGEVIDVRAPERIVFSYGYASGSPIPPGGSQVTIRLDSHPSGTLLQLTHDFADAEIRDQHIQGWRFQLSLFANAVANKVNGSAAQTVDQWFAAWSDPQATSREATLSAISASDIRFYDRFSCIAGEDEVKAHLAAVHRFMPGMRLERRGDVRHCQSHVLADWVALAADGQERGRGTNLFVLNADGRIAQVTGFWA